MRKDKTGKSDQATEQTITDLIARFGPGTEGEAELKQQLNKKYPGWESTPKLFETSPYVDLLTNDSKNLFAHSFLTDPTSLFSDQFSSSLRAFEAFNAIEAKYNFGSILERNEQIERMLALNNSFGGSSALADRISRFSSSAASFGGIVETILAGDRFGDRFRFLDLITSEVNSRREFWSLFDPGKEVLGFIDDGEGHDVALADTEPSELVLVDSRAHWAEKIREYSVNPKILRAIDPRAFEELIAELLDRDGYQVELTKRTRDGGRDILAYSEDAFGQHLFLVECKRYAESNHVDVDIVRALFGVLKHEQATGAMVVTTSSFTKPAKEFADQHTYQMTLHDFDFVRFWLAKHKL